MIGSFVTTLGGGRGPVFADKRTKQLAYLARTCCGIISVGGWNCYTGKASLRAPVQVCEPRPVHGRIVPFTGDVAWHSERVGYASLETMHFEPEFDLPKAGQSVYHHEANG